MTPPAGVARPLRRRGLAAGLAVALVWPWARAACARDPELLVALPDGRGRRFSGEDLLRLPREKGNVTLRDGAQVVFEGVSVLTFLRLTGLDLAAHLGGGVVASQGLLARGADGYRAIFGLAELDPRFGRAPVLVVWSGADGSPLTPEAGPLQLIVPADARPSRWVRQLTAIEVIAPK